MGKVWKSSDIFPQSLENSSVFAKSWLVSQLCEVDGMPICCSMAPWKVAFCFIEKKTPSIWLTGYCSRMGYHCTHIQRMKIKTIGVNSFEPYMRNIFGWVKSRFSQVLSDKYLSSQAKLWQNCCVQNWGTLRYSNVAIFQILHRNFDVFPIQTSISWLEFSIATLPDGYPKTIHVLRDGQCWKVRSPTVHQLACWSWSPLQGCLWHFEGESASRTKLWGCDMLHDTMMLLSNFFNTCSSWLNSGWIRILQSDIILIWQMINGNFRILKWRYCTI